MTGKGTAFHPSMYSSALGILFLFKVDPVRFFRTMPGGAILLLLFIPFCARNETLGRNEGGREDPSSRFLALAM